MLTFPCPSLMLCAIVFILETPFTQCKHEHWCNNQIYTVDKDHNTAFDPPVDKYPDNFHVIEEVKTFTFGHILESLQNEELYYSQSAGRARVDHNDPSNAYTYWMVPEGNKKLEYVSRGTNCSAKYVSPSSLAGQRFRVTTDSMGSVHLGKPSDVFSYSMYLQKQVYVDTKTVPDRGFPASHFQTCHYNAENDTAALVDWYITDPGIISMPGRPDDAVLVMAKTIGFYGNGQMFNTRKDYTHFTIGVLPTVDRHYELSNDGFCHSPQSIPNKPVPDFPKDFRFKREVTFSRKSDGATTMHYDVVRYISSFQVYTEEMELPPVPPITQLAQHITSVYDFNTGLLYRLDKFRGECSVTPVSQSLMGLVEEGGRMANGQKLMMELDIGSYSFLDVMHLDDRNMIVDTFTASEDNVNYVWYFANKDWMQSVGYAETYTMPVRKVQETPDFFSVSDYFAYTEDIFADIPDISACFAASDVDNIIMTFNGSYDRFVWPDPRGFKELMALSLILPGLGTPLRLASLDIRPLTTDSFTVLFKLLSVHPSLAHASNVSDNSQFIQTLQRAASSGRISIAPPWIKDPPLQSTAMSAAKRTMSGDWSVVSTSSSSSGGYATTDVAAGVALASLVMGFIVGLAATLAIHKRRNRTGEVQLDLSQVRQPRPSVVRFDDSASS